MDTKKQTTSIVSLCRLASAVSSASNELDKSERTIKWLEEEQQSAQEFLNMKHFTFNTDSKLARFVDKFIINLSWQVIIHSKVDDDQRVFFHSCCKTVTIML